MYVFIARNVQVQALKVNSNAVNTKSLWKVRHSLWSQFMTLNLSKIIVIVMLVIIMRPDLCLFVTNKVNNKNNTIPTFN